MTDEEKVEEYARNVFNPVQYEVTLSTREIQVRLEMAYKDGRAEGRKEGYEQGYEDCRHYAHDYYKPKWHDLRKDPKDLPKKSGEYWCKWEDGTYCTAHYFEVGGFCDCTIAWCELPKFEG